MQAKALLFGVNDLVLSAKSPNIFHISLAFHFCFYVLPITLKMATNMAAQIPKSTLMQARAIIVYMSLKR